MAMWAWTAAPSSAQQIVFSHGWPLSGDDWDAQTLFFGRHGYRVVVNEMNTYSDDLTAQLVPIGATGLMSAKLLKKATLKVYPGLPHAMATTHPDRINADLLKFVKSYPNLERTLHVSE